MTEVYVYEIGEVSEEYFERLLEFAFQSRREKVKKLKNRPKRLQSLFGELVTKAVLSQKLQNTDSTNMAFEYNEYGKPCLSEDCGIHFNVSHTDGLVAVAVSDSEVGIDAEKVRALATEHIDRICSPKEKAFVNAEVDGRLDRFFEVWTAKEAYTKSIGKGLSFPLNAVEVPKCGIGVLHTIRYGEYVISVYGNTAALNVFYHDKTSDLLEKYLNANANQY